MAGSVLFLFLFSTFCIFALNPVSMEQKISCEDSSNKTLCSRNSTKSCIEHKRYLLTLAEKRYLILLHSNIRRNLTKGLVEGLPKAFHMKKISWNESLAKLAQKLADRCKSIKTSRIPTGLVVFEVDKKAGKGLKELAGKWTTGLKHLTPEIISEYRKPKPESFDYAPAAQMIWWNTSFLGCGRSAYKSEDCIGDKLRNCSRVTRVQLVCNYYPVGNKEGNPVYLTVKESICQYEDNHGICQNMTDRGEKNCEADTKGTKRAKDKLSNRFRTKMTELWPAVARANPLEAKWDNFTFFILLFMMKENFYVNFSNRIFNNNESA